MRPRNCVTSDRSPETNVEEEVAHIEGTFHRVIIYDLQNWTEYDMKMEIGT